MKRIIDARKAISQFPFNGNNTDWQIGVRKYAQELFTVLLKQRGIEDEADYIGSVTRDELLNGAKSWYEYSRNGYTLTNANAIRERLSPTSSKYNEDFWLDTQAEALNRAAQIVVYAVNNHFADEKWVKGAERRFFTLTDDPAKLKKLGDLISKVGKENVVFLLQNLKLSSAMK